MLTQINRNNLDLTRYGIWLGFFLLMLCCVDDVQGASGVYVAGSDDWQQVPVIVPNFNVSDTIPIVKDSVAVDSFVVDSAYLEKAAFLYSKDTLDAQVDYYAKDTTVYDIRNEKIFLYGDAWVTYKEIRLEADYIVFDWGSNIVTAEGMPDSVGQMAGFPVFEDGSQNFTAQKMRFNFKSRKGMVYDVTTTQNDVQVLGSQSKFISQPARDSTEERNDVVYSRDAIFTTCTHPEPHFGIRSKKQKIIPNKLVVVGASNLELMGVPTPLWLPFGFFPIQTGRRTGLIFPSDYEYSPQLGFGLREVGWFFPLGEHFNLTMTGDIYLRGTWRLNARSQYRKRYKYSGSFSLGFSNNLVESTLDGSRSPNRSFSVIWNHTQAPTAHPTQKFSGAINFQTNGYRSQVYNDANSVLNNQLSSNMTYSFNPRDLPFNLSASLNHNQNTRSGLVTISFPNLQFRTQTLYPFRSKSGSRGKWTDNVTVRYTNDIQNRYEAQDSVIFQPETFDDMQFGVRHNVTSGTSFKLFRYFNLNPNFSYREVWYLSSLRKELVEEVMLDSMIVYNSDGTDSTLVINSEVDREQIDTQVDGFERFYQMSTSLNLNTQIFGTANFEKGFIRGLRHVIKPTIGFSFSPDYLNPDLGWYREVENENDPTEFDRYSIFQGGIFGSPSSAGQQMALTYSINNIFEAKIFSRKDSLLTPKEKGLRKIKLFNNIIVNGNYNFAADSLKWSPVSMGGTARFFKGATTLNVRATFDPYSTDANGRRINEFHWRNTGKILRFDQFRANLSTRLTVGKIRAIFQGEEEEYVEEVGIDGEARRDPNNRDNRRAPQEDFLSLFENFSINHNMVFVGEQPTVGQDTFYMSTNSIDLRGRIQLTPNWNIRVGRIGYDFKRKNITFPSFGFSRDLHCWEMGLDWQPTRGTYRFYIQVKPGTMDFLKIPYQRNNFDARRVFD